MVWRLYSFTPQNLCGNTTVLDASLDVYILVLHILVLQPYKHSYAHGSVFGKLFGGLGHFGKDMTIQDCTTSLYSSRYKKHKRISNIE